MKKIIILSIALLLLLLTSCKNVEIYENPQENKTDIVFMASGNSSDDDMNAQIIDALKNMEKSAAITVNVIEVEEKESYSRILKSLAEEKKYDLIMIAGYTTGKALDSIAKDYPEQLFACIDYISNAKNVLSIAFRQEEAAFYSGVLAALMTKENKIGLVSSFENQESEYIYGFITGVKAVNEDIETVVEYTKSYTDIETGTQAAKNIDSQGADIIYSCATAPTSNIIDYAEKKDIKVINSDIYTFSQSSDALICVTKKKYKTSVEYIVNAAMDIIKNMQQSEDDEISTDLRYVGVAQNAYEFVMSKKVDNAVKDKLKAVDIMILDSEFIVPNNEAMYENFDFSVFEGKAFRK